MLTLGYTCRSDDCGVAYDIEVPRSLSVRVDADTASISLTSLAGQVHATSDVGYIHGENLADTVADSRDPGQSRRRLCDGGQELSPGEGGRSVQVVAQHLGAGRVPELRHRLRLDLPDPLPGHPVNLADLVERLWLAVGQAEPHRDHACLAL